MQPYVLNVQTTFVNTSSKLSSTLVISFQYPIFLDCPHIWGKIDKCGKSAKPVTRETRAEIVLKLFYNSVLRFCIVANLSFFL